MNNDIRYKKVPIKMLYKIELLYPTISKLTNEIDNSIAPINAEQSNNANTFFILCLI